MVLEKRPGTGIGKSSTRGDFLLPNFVEFRRFIMGTGTVLVSVPGISHFSGGIGTGIGKIWYRKKVLEPVSVKFGTDKKSRNQYR